LGQHGKQQANEISHACIGPGFIFHEGLRLRWVSLTCDNEWIEWNEMLCWPAI